MVWKLGWQIWTYSLFLMSISQWHTCVVYISLKLKISVRKSWNQQPRKPLRTTYVITTPFKTIAEAYLSNRECSVQEVVYYILLELKPRRIFLAVYFVHTNIQEERNQVLLPEKELNILPMILHIFSRDLILTVM